MKWVLMDADCIIKITRAGYKEMTMETFNISLPEAIKREVIDQGESRSESTKIGENIRLNKVRIVKSNIVDNGDDALVEVFHRGSYAFIATDDKRLISRLTNVGIPCVVPGLLLYYLFKSGKIDREEALRKLEKLSRSVSADEFQIVRFLLLEG
jgi:rRNA-processing protein FCF1